jgi:hypothetical protein
VQQVCTGGSNGLRLFTIAVGWSDVSASVETPAELLQASVGIAMERVDARSDAQKEAANIYVPLYRFGHVDEARIALLSTSQFGNLLRRSRRVNPMRALGSVD